MYRFREGLLSSARSLKLRAWKHKKSTIAVMFGHGIRLAG